MTFDGQMCFSVIWNFLAEKVMYVGLCGYPDVVVQFYVHLLHRLNFVGEVLSSTC